MRRLVQPVALWAFVWAQGAVPPASAGDQGTIDVIILADQDASSVATEVESRGGRVGHVYRNVPALAAQVPAQDLASIRALKGVASVEKDAPVYLADEPARSRERLLTSVTVESRVGETEVRALDVRTGPVRPNTYVNYLLTGAAAVWSDTGFGDGSIVAVVDTGTYPVAPCLSAGQVIGAPGFPDGFDAVGDNPADAPDNNPHGTWVGNVIASQCSIATLPTSALARAIAAYAPGLLYPIPSEPGYVGLDLLGVAPLAKIYPVKVFSKSGGGTATSAILTGLDHVLGLKKSGQLDVDVVNLSLGGPTLFDGRDAFDRFIDELRKAGIVVVTSASNDGPTPNTVASPATSFSSIAAAATDEAIPSRIFYEYLGLVYGADGAPGTGDEEAGDGLLMRPTAETRIVNFSSRGPASDGRLKPEIAALGTWNFVQAPSGGFNWVTGTSFSAPTTSAAAALLNAYWEGTLGRETDPAAIRNALLFSADARRVGPEWRNVNAQGLGVLDLVSALDRLKKPFPFSGSFFPLYAGRLTPNVLGEPHAGRSERSRWRSVELKPAEVRDFVFEIDRSTSKVSIEFENLAIPDNSRPAYFPNGLEVDLQSAKRSATERPVSFLLDSNFSTDVGGTFTIEVEDGLWSFAGIPVAEQPMEPGLMKLSLSGDFVNEKAVGARVRITRENDAERLRKPISKSVISQDDVFIVPVEIPEGTTRATFNLKWQRDWSRFPTSDLDLVVYDPDFNEFADGATLNAPERSVVTNPVPGTYYALVFGFQVDKTDFYRLYVQLE
jgi:subtilisin family serine protease